MFDLIASILAWFYSLVPSVGLAIIMLTLVVMVVLTPVTLKGTRSMIKMQHLGPELKKIQARHKGNRETLNQEMMAFYKANNINPMGGCLPLFAQMPVFLVLYQVLRGITRRMSDLGDSTGWVAGRLSVGETLGGAPTDPQAFYPAYVDHGSEIFRDLSNRSEMVFLGMDLSRSATSALSESVIATLPYILLILVVGVSSWFQQRQIRGRNPDAAINPQMQMMMKVMPFFLPLISFQLDASLVVYFVVSNLYRIGQQAYITRSLYGPNAEVTPVVVPEKVKPTKETKTAPSPKKTSPTSEDRSSSGSSARSGRTTAGSNEKSSQQIDDEAPAEGGSETRTPKARKPAKSATPAKKKKKKSGRRDRKGATDEPILIDKRPPAARGRGGRTTPPGTSRARGSKKKRRK